MIPDPQQIFDQLLKEYKIEKSFLNYETPFQLAIAVLLSAQCTDKLVNKVTPHLFKNHGTPQKIAAATEAEIIDLVKSVNYYKTKGKHIYHLSIQLIKEFHAIIPNTIEDLIKLPGIGRKSANVIIGHIHKKPAVTVDTHVRRVSQRIGFTKEKDPTKIEFELKKKWPKDIWFDLSTLLILHGRHICQARKPQCPNCVIEKNCLYPNKTKV